MLTANGSEFPNTVYLPGTAPPTQQINTSYAWTLMTPYTSNMTGPLHAVSDDNSSLLPFDGDICLVDNQTFYISTHAIPNVTFPFGRLAAIYLNDTTLIYHQFNESLILEETADEALGLERFGKATEIIVPTQ